jgi:hypothetical protein
MDKRETTVLIWILSLASVLVIILYSPIGSPDIYSKSNRLSSINGVVFQGKIENSSGASNFGGQNGPELIIDSYSISDPTVSTANSLNENVSVEVADPTKKEIPVYTQENKKRTRYRVANNNESVSEQNATYAVANFGSKQSEYNNSGGSGTVGGITPTFGSSGRNSRNNSYSGNNDFTVTSLDLSLFSDSTMHKHAVDYAKSQGGTDPGSNPTSDPIPVSSGTLFLTLLVSAYTICKMANMNKMYSFILSVFVK